MNVNRWSTVLLTAVLVVGCGDDDNGTEPPVVTVEDFVGSWTATSQTFTSNTNPQDVVEIVALGADTRITVLSGGRARTWFAFADIDEEWDGQLSVSGNLVTNTPVEAARPTRTWSFMLSGSVMTVSRNDSEFDFTLTGAPNTSATEVIVFVRQ